MKEIQLSRGYVTWVDDDVYEWAQRFEWHTASGRRGKVYAARSENGKKVMLHRQIMDAKEGELVDHEDGDGLNNRRGNLRLATAAQNAANRPGAAAYKGVRYDRHTGAFTATVRQGGTKRVQRGFATAEEAALAYNEMARQVHGEFAWLNEVDRPAPVLTVLPKPKVNPLHEPKKGWDPTTQEIYRKLMARLRAKGIV